MISGLIGLIAILFIVGWIFYRKVVMKNRKSPLKGQVTDKSSKTSLPRGKDGTCIFVDPKHHRAFSLIQNNNPMTSRF